MEDKIGKDELIIEPRYVFDTMRSEFKKIINCQPLKFEFARLNGS